MVENHQTVEKNLEKKKHAALPINDAAHPIPFETSLFKGVAMIRIADISTSPVEYFSGKRRRMQVKRQQVERPSEKKGGGLKSGFRGGSFVFA